MTWTKQPPPSDGETYWDGSATVWDGGETLWDLNWVKQTPE